MLIAIDIGNTNTTIGIFRKNKLLLERRISSFAQRTEDELWLSLKSFCEQLKTSPAAAQGAVIASVVPERTESFTRMIKKYLKHQPVIVSGTLDVGITLAYDDPNQLGADRICGVVAAYKKFGGPSIVIDFGTATTFDAVSGKGVYLGGVIAPGLETSSNELFKRTAKLPRIEFLYPDAVLGQNTITAIQSGVMYCAVDAADSMIRRIKRIIGKYATVVATGGFASLIAEMSNEIKYVEPNLVLEGAQLIYENVTSKTKK